MESTGVVVGIYKSDGRAINASLVIYLVDLSIYHMKIKPIYAGR